MMSLNLPDDDDDQPKKESGCGPELECNPLWFAVIGVLVIIFVTILFAGDRSNYTYHPEKPHARAK